MAAAAAPIVIHLWMRHTYRESPWAAMRFLQAAIKRQARRMQLQQWLLLALRTLILLLVAVAAAKPFLSDLGWIGGGTRVHRVLVIDTSLSMSAVEREDSRFARAIALATEMIDASRPGESFSLVTLADPPQVRLSGPVADKSRVKAELAQLETNFGTAELPATLALVSQVIADADQRSEPFDRHEVVCLSDLGKNTWGSVAGERQSIAHQLSASTELIVVDVGSDSAANLSVSQLELADAFPTAGRPITVSAVIDNHSADVARDMIVELQVDGVVSEERRVSIEAASSTAVSFTRTMPEAGWHRFELHLPDDALRGDDREYLVANLPESVGVLCVEGRPGAARYLASALNPTGERSGQIVPTVISAGGLRDTRLEDFRCVLLSNVGELTASEAEQLTVYVRNGGGLGIFLGDAVNVDSYNATARRESKITFAVPDPHLVLFGQLLASDVATRQSLLPVKLLPPVSQTTYGIDPLEYQHPIASVFRGREQSGLLSTPISRHCPLEVTSAEAKVALALSDGSPLLVTCRLGDGMVAVCGTAASLDSIDPATGQPWTLWPAWPSFLPVVRELVDYLENDRATLSRVVADDIAGRAKKVTNEPITVTRPDERVDSLVVADNEWRYDDLDLPGIYAVNSEASEQLLAVNTLAAESDLTPVSADDLQPGIKVVSDLSYSSFGGESLSSTAWLHRWLLYAVLLLLVTESIVANRWGRASS